MSWLFSGAMFFKPVYIYFTYFTNGCVITIIMFIKSGQVCNLHRFFVLFDTVNIFVNCDFFPGVFWNRRVTETPTLCYVYEIGKVRASYKASMVIYMSHFVSKMTVYSCSHFLYSFLFKNHFHLVTFCYGRWELTFSVILLLISSKFEALIDTLLLQ